MEESLQNAEAHVSADDDYVEFWPAGTHAKGRFRCAACGSAVTVLQVLPRCGACGELLWERAEWTPLSPRLP